jgi:hypothetical protein
MPPTKSPALSLDQIEQIRRQLGLPTHSISYASRSLNAGDLDHLAENLDLWSPLTFTSHRKYIGDIIVWTKNILFNRFLSRILKIGLVRQDTLNYYLYLNAATLIDLNLKIRTLEARIEALEAKK